MSFPGIEDPQCFATLKYALEQAQAGEKLVINSCRSFVFCIALRRWRAGLRAHWNSS